MIGILLLLGMACCGSVIGYHVAPLPKRQWWWVVGATLALILLSTLFDFWFLRGQC